jgi:hypothetical protein
MQVDLQYEPVKKEERRGQEKQPDASLEEDAVVLARVPATRDELENAAADEPHEILNHGTIVACPC